MPSGQIRLLPEEGRPKLELEAFKKLIGATIDFQTYPLAVVGMRGYFSKALSQTHENQRGIYDDALFLYAPSENFYKAFNGNTDPSKIRLGIGTGEGKGIASLNPGVWPAYRFDIHGSRVRPYEAICQRAAPVEVTRDGTPPYRDTGMFGINIHKGGVYATSSEGCQTVPPMQWDEFITTAQSVGKKVFGVDWRKKTIVYALLDQATYAGAESHPSTVSNPNGSTAGVSASKKKALDLLETVIRPTLQALNLASRPAELLLLGTAIAESGLEERVQRGNGPARGLFQMEPNTHQDIWDNYLKYRPALAAKVKALKKNDWVGDADQLQHNDEYACAMARVHYWRVPSKIPDSGKIEDLAAYWKSHYNTPQGGGTVKHFVDAWNSFMQ